MMKQGYVEKAGDEDHEDRGVCSTSEVVLFCDAARPLLCCSVRVALRRGARHAEKQRNSHEEVWTASMLRSNTDTHVSKSLE